MIAILIRARRSNYDLGERETRYLTWTNEILNKDDIIDKDVDYDIDRAFCVIEINSMEELLGLIDEFGRIIIIEKISKKGFEYKQYGVSADYLITIYDDYIE